MKFVALQEFVDFGYLQEVNRAFFHPRGMALAVDLEERKIVVIDDREDLEGWIFGVECPLDREKYERVLADLERRKPIREAALGFWQQPVPSGNEP